MFAQGTATNLKGVTGTRVTAGGTGYTSAPTVAFTGGTTGGTCATTRLVLQRSIMALLYLFR